MNRARQSHQLADVLDPFEALDDLHGLFRDGFQQHERRVAEEFFHQADILPRSMTAVYSGSLIDQIDTASREPVLRFQIQYALDAVM